MTKLDTAKFLSMNHIYTDRAETERRETMSAMMFEPITDADEIQSTLNGRSGKGETLAFINKAEEAFQAYIAENPEGHFILPLNEREGTKFFGKETASLYSSLYQVLKANDLTTTWRLVRITKDEKSYLRLVRL